MSPSNNEDPIVISGMTGRVPQAANLQEYKYKIYNKLDMISLAQRYIRSPETPERMGLIPRLDLFDAGFFSVQPKNANEMDPMLRIAYEVTCEALWDAGISLDEIKGARAGVYLGLCYSENEAANFFDQRENIEQLISSTRLGFAEKLSHFLQIEGPAYAVDAACSSSMYGVQHAFDDLKAGKIDYAIVGGFSVMQAACLTDQFARLGVLSHDGASKSFDLSANGYARSEAAVTIIMQRASTAKRQYAEIIHALTNCDGFKERGLTFPSKDVQMQLFEKFYSDCNIPKNLLGFMEAHGTGTKVGDPVELGAIYDFFCNDRKEPLLLGSVKSNLGHAEGASGLISIVKACWTLESNLVAPNIHYKNPNTSCLGLLNGKLQVVTDVTELPVDKPYVGVNNFGFSGANGHILLTKASNRRSTSTKFDHPGTKLVCLSGRTEAAVMSLYDDMKSRAFDPGFIALLNASFGNKTALMDYRGYCTVDINGVSPIEITELKVDPLPLKCFLDTSGVAKLGPSLMKYKCFQDHIKHTKDFFSRHNIQEDLVGNSKASDGSIDNVLATVVIQTGVINLLKEAKLDISSYVGSGIGELSAAYADGVLKLEQTFLIAHRIVKLLRKKRAKINANMISTEIQEICNIVQAPQKWHLQTNNTINDNLSAYFAEVLFTAHLPRVTAENILVIGGNAAPSKTLVSLCDRRPELAFEHCIGRLHLLAYNMDINQLFSVEWPVKAATPMVSPVIKWAHMKTWKYSIKFHGQEKKCLIINQWRSADWMNLIGHNIDGRVLFPATGYLRVAWRCKASDCLAPFKFENVVFHRACTISPNQDTCLTVHLMQNTGLFEILEKDSVVVTGTIKNIDNFDEEWMNLPALPMEQGKNTMNKRDIYKELGLRGYYYQGQFKELQSCDLAARVAQLKWTEWCPFMDNMLQMKILDQDTRGLFVPTKIRQIIIHPEKHWDVILMSGDAQNCILPVYHYKEMDVIRSGYVEIRGLQASSIAKRKNPIPVLEGYRFVPYVANLNLETAARVMVQLALENSYGTRVKAIEAFNDVPTSMEPILPYIENALNDQPLVQPELAIIANKHPELANIPVIEIVPSDNSCVFAIGYNLSKNSTLLRTLLSSLKENGFLISRENIKSQGLIDGMVIICEYTTPTERVVMMKAHSAFKMPKPIHITEAGFEWVTALKNSRVSKENLLLYSENEPNNGLMGLTNCLLRESGGEVVMNVLIDHAGAPRFDVNNEFYKKQLQKRLAVNVLKDGVWGSYRHLLIDQNATVDTVHSYVYNTIKGDLSSLTWVQGMMSIPENFNAESVERIHIYFCGLNFRDVMLASGKLTLESQVPERLQQDNILGMEFSGRAENGERVMGMWRSGAFSNIIQVTKNVVWSIPNHWSMAEAATIPCVYLTNIYGLLMRAQLCEGESILIQSATGGIGLSAINIAMYYNCKIFLTVGTPKKREYVLKNYPSIPPEHIGSSRDTSFYEMILKNTDGKGVSIILNSLADEKLQVSVKCLSVGGRFIEIGKFDCTQDSPLRTELAEKEGEYHGVMLDNILKDTTSTILTTLGKHLTDGIAKGYVKPIPSTLFKRDQLEPAFRHMTTGKHIGKIILSIREEEKQKIVIPKLLKCQARPKLYCNPAGCYIILGGLGGFGLELADHLILRGARKLILVSRRGITSGYQSRRLKIWKSYRCDVSTSTLDCTTKEGCEALLQAAQELGDVMGIFNLAVVLRDAILENQTEQSFIESYNPKAQCTIYLDQLSRTLCPNLQHFVVFSSVSCGRGNAGQTNYGYSNSVMEKICETRKKAGLPGKAIQWGVIGDVGIVADFKEQNVDIVIGGTLHQRIANCLEVLDVLLTSDDAIVSSMVVAEKQTSAGSNDIISTVCEMLLIKDVKTVSPNATFPELGMDSMMAVEIKQTLERDFDVFLSPQELRNMTFVKLATLSSRTDEASLGTETSRSTHLQQLMRFIPSEDQCSMPMVVMKETDSPLCLYLMPGIEGTSTVFEPLVKKLSVNVKCLQFQCDNTADTMTGLVQQKYKILKKELKKNVPFMIAAHSMGITCALETVSLLERDGYIGTLLILDGSPSGNKAILAGMLGTGSEETMQTNLISNIMSAFLPIDAITKLETLLANSSFKQKCQQAIDLSEQQGHKEGFLHQLMTNIYCRVKSENMHCFQPRTYKSKLILCKAEISIFDGLSEDFGLTQLVGKQLVVEEFCGDHISFLENDKFIQYVENIANNN